MPSPEAWAGRGSGAACVICAGTILTRDVEYEVPSSRGGADASEHLCAHLACYLVWQQEAKAVGTALP